MQLCGWWFAVPQMAQWVVRTPLNHTHVSMGNLSNLGSANVFGGSLASRIGGWRLGEWIVSVRLCARFAIQRNFIKTRNQQFANLPVLSSRPCVIFHSS